VTKTEFKKTEGEENREKIKELRNALAQSNPFDTRVWEEFCDVSLTLKQACKSEDGRWIKIDEHQCRRASRHLMNLLNRAVYGNTVKRHGKRLRVIPVLGNDTERDPRETTVRHRGKCKRALPIKGRGRWHIHCAIELPKHIDAVDFEQLIHACWAKVHWGFRRVLVRDGTNQGWIDYLLKRRQKSQFESWSDCIILETLHNPITYT
jgi:hypothetical protein